MAGGRVVGTYQYVDPFSQMIRGAGLMASSWLKAAASEMAIGAAVAATGGVVGSVLSGMAGSAATEAAFIEIANVTVAGARYANVTAKLSAREFQANLMSGGYRVVRQGVGQNGPFTVLTKGEKTYTIYTASSTGGASAQVQVAGQTVSKIRLSVF